MKTLFATISILGLLAAGFFYSRNTSISTVGASVQPNKSAFAGKTLKNGDILFQSSEGGQGKAIQLATGSKYNHCGMIYIKGAEIYVLEANGPVGLTPYLDFINRGNGKWVTKRLKNRDEYFKDVQDSAFYREAKKLMGIKYDPYFGWDDELIYCSELVWKMYDRAQGVKLADLQQMKEFKLDNPIVKAKLQERFGDNIPLEENVISPARIFDSPLLEKVDGN